MAGNFYGAPQSQWEEFARQYSPGGPMGGVRGAPEYRKGASYSDENLPPGQWSPSGNGFIFQPDTPYTKGPEQSLVQVMDSNGDPYRSYWGPGAVNRMAAGVYDPGVSDADLPAWQAANRANYIAGKGYKNPQAARPYGPPPGYPAAPLSADNTGGQYTPPGTPYPGPPGGGGQLASVQAAPVFGTGPGYGPPAGGQVASTQAGAQTPYAGPGPGYGAPQGAQMSPQQQGALMEIMRRAQGGPAPGPAGGMPGVGYSPGYMSAFNQVSNMAPGSRGMATAGTPGTRQPVIQQQGGQWGGINEGQFQPFMSMSDDIANLHGSQTQRDTQGHGLYQFLDVAGRQGQPNYGRASLVTGGDKAAAWGALSPDDQGMLQNYVTGFNQRWGGGAPTTPGAPAGPAPQAAQSVAAPPGAPAGPGRLERLRGRMQNARQMGDTDRWQRLYQRRQNVLGQRGMR